MSKNSMKQDSDDYELEDEYEVSKLPIMPKGQTQKTAIGIAWYKPEQWQRLLDISSDRENLEETYEAWLKAAENTMRAMQKRGLFLVEVDVDVEELFVWCQSQRIPVNSEARSRYAAEKLRQASIKRGEKAHTDHK